MDHHSGHEIAYELRCAVVTCRILYESPYAEIEKKLGVKQKTAQSLMKRAVDRAGCTDIFEVLACVRIMDRSGAPQRVEDGSETSANMRIAILRYPDMKPHEAVVDQENIPIPGMPGDKRLARSVIERVAHTHEHVQGDRKIGEISRVVQPNKPLLTHVNENKRLTICLWIIERLEAGDIFISSDESYHEVGGGNKRKISIIKGDDPHEFATTQPSVQFSIMQWGAISSDGTIGPLHLWGTESKKEREECDLKLKEANSISRQKIDEKRRKALIPGTVEFETLQVHFLFISYLLRSMICLRKVGDEHRD